MHQFFNTPNTPNTGLLSYPDIRFVQRTINHTWVTVKDYYRDNSLKIDSKHLLLKLMSVVKADLELPVEELYPLLMEEADDWAKRIRINSPLHRYRPTTEEFLLPRGVTKLIISDTDDFDIDNIEDTWMDLEPIRYMRHHSTNLSFPIGDDVEDTISCCISINIPMLVIQYQQYLKLSGDVPNLKKFLSSYPLNNAKLSFFYHAAFNRLMAMSRGEDLPRYDDDHPFHLGMLKSPKMIDDLCKFYLGKLANRDFNFIEVLKLLDWGDLDSFELMHVPTMPSSIQTNWLFLTARIDIIEWLLDVDDSNGAQVNTTFKSRWRTQLKGYLSQNLIANAPLPVWWKREVHAKAKDVYSRLVKK